MTTPETWQKPPKRNTFSESPGGGEPENIRKELKQAQWWRDCIVAWRERGSWAQDLWLLSLYCLSLPLLLILSTISNPKLHSWWIWAEAPKSSSGQKWLPWMRGRAPFCKQPAYRSIVVFTYNFAMFHRSDFSVLSFWTLSSVRVCMVIFMPVGVEQLSIERHENLGNLVFLLLPILFLYMI